MILGTVSAKLEARISLEILGAKGSSVHADVSIDTGFTGNLALDRGLVQALGLTPAGVTEGLLADGQTVMFETYYATVDWHGAVRTVTVIESDGGNLIGMSLLKNSRVVINVVCGGSVAISPV